MLSLLQIKARGDFFSCFLRGIQGRHEIADSASERDDALCKVLSELDIQKYLLSLPCCCV